MSNDTVLLYTFLMQTGQTETNINSMKHFLLQGSLGIELPQVAGTLRPSSH
jgi:hypothetical protein